MISDSRPLLNLDEACKRLGGISKPTLYTWLSLGKFGLRRTKVGSRTMLRESELLKVINAGARRRSNKEGIVPMPTSEEIVRNLAESDPTVGDFGECPLCGDFCVATTKEDPKQPHIISKHSPACPYRQAVELVAKWDAEAVGEKA